jgi:hypothetical protein
MFVVCVLEGGEIKARKIKQILKHGHENKERSCVAVNQPRFVFVKPQIKTWF